MDKAMEKKQKRLGILKVSLSVLFGIAAAALFVALGAMAADSVPEWFETVYAVSALLLIILLFPVGMLAAILFVRKKRKMKVAEGVELSQEYYDDVQRDREAVIRRLHRTAVLVRLNYVLVGVLAALTAFGYGTDGEDVSFVIFAFYAFIALGSTVFRNIKEKTDLSGFAARADYPELYALADSAKQALGIRGTVHICFDGGCNANVAKDGSNILIKLGIELLDLTTADELYQVMLHESAHLSRECCPYPADVRLNNNISYKTAEAENWFEVCFALVHTVYTFRYALSQTFINQYIEKSADSVILRFGDKNAAASMLAKLAMFGLFELEESDLTHVCFFEPETYNEHYCAEVYCPNVRKAFALREEFWRGLLKNEIQSRTASHPTLKNRLAALGVEDYTVTLPEGDDAYRRDCARAVELWDSKLTEYYRDIYADGRQRNYLDPFKAVTDFEDGGCVIDYEQARTVIEAYSALNRLDEAEALCERVIAEADNDYLKAFPLYFKGMRLLDRYDRSGIELVYRAIGLNANFTEAGLDRIGHFCCLMGLETELEEYRAKYADVLQYKADHSENGLSERDKLVPEQFPDDRLPGMIDYMVKAGEGYIWRIFLVKKIVNDEYAPSVFIIHLEDDTPEKIADEIMYKIFNYLDTLPVWEYSLYRYERSYVKLLEKVKGSCVYIRGETERESEQN